MYESFAYKFLVFIHISSNACIQLPHLTEGTIGLPRIARKVTLV